MLNDVNIRIWKYNINNHLGSVITYANRQFSHLYKFTKIQAEELMRLGGSKISPNPK